MNSKTEKTENLPVQDKLLFSNVWEDPQIESDVIKRCKPVLYNDENRYKMLMVCSGGDTLIHILCENQDEFTTSNLWIDVLDSNRMQIATAVFKILVLHYLRFINSSSLYYDIIYGSCIFDYEELIQILKTTYKSIQWSQYLDIWEEGDNINILKNGLCRSGEMEKTFKNLIDSAMNFDSNFNHDTLTHRFGDAAVKLTSQSNNFVDRFRLIYNRYVEYYGTDYDANRFYHRMIKGHDSHTTLRPVVTKFKSVTIDMLNRIRFIYQDMASFAASLGIPTYDVIQTSNITDWLMTRDNVQTFVKNIYSICRFKGEIVWRSLNGEYDLIDLLKKQYHDDECADKKIEFKNDTSHFYKTVVISRPPVNINALFKMMSSDKTYDNTKILDSHPYFAKLRLDLDALSPFTVEEFLNTQIQFYHAVKNWVCVLKKVSSKLIHVGREDLSNVLCENIDDELGIDSKTGEKTGIPHTETFKAFLKGLADKAETTYQLLDEPSECVERFNNQLDEIMATKSLAHVCAYLGAIEYQYISISKMIKNYADYHQIIQPHYTMHEILDDKHSADLFDIAVSVSVELEEVVNGALSGRTEFLRLYAGMYHTWARDRI